MNLSRNIFVDYFDNKISKWTLAKEIGLNNKDFPVVLNKELKNTLEKQDSEMLEFLVYALILWDEKKGDEITSLKSFSPILNKLIVCKWHKQHENIVMLIQKIADEKSMEYLNKAIYLQLKYLEWDDNFSFQIKCIRAIGKIGGLKAVSILKSLSEIDNPIIKEFSKKQLEKILN